MDSYALFMTLPLFLRSVAGASIPVNMLEQEMNENKQAITNIHFSADNKTPCLHENLKLITAYT
jgi:hypothetical protein